MPFALTVYCAICHAAPATSTAGRAKAASTRRQPSSQTQAQQQTTIAELLLRLEAQKEETANSQKQFQEAEAACVHAETTHREQQQHYEAELDRGERLLNVIQHCLLASALLNMVTLYLHFVRTLCVAANY